MHNRVEPGKPGIQGLLDQGTGYTLLFYKEDLPNRNVVYNEYEKDGVTYTGTFTFKNDSYMSGVYTRSDGTDFTIKRKR